MASSAQPRHHHGRRAGHDSPGIGYDDCHALVHGAAGSRLGILSAGSATGQLIFLTPAAWIAETQGWRMALLPFVVLIGLLALMFAVLSRDRPADIGLAPYGEDEVLPAPPPPSGNVFAVSIDALRMASGSLVFWVLAFTFFVCGVSSFGLMPHFVTLCGDCGINPITSTSLLAMIGVFDFIGTIGSGWLSDRYDNRWLLVGYYALRGVSLIWLPFSGFSLIGLSFFAVPFPNPLGGRRPRSGIMLTSLRSRWL